MTTPEPLARSMGVMMNRARTTLARNDRSSNAPMHARIGNTTQSAGARVTNYSRRMATRLLRGKGTQNVPKTSKPVDITQRKPDSTSLCETIRLAQQGDATAFETIYHLHSRRVYALCLRMLGDPVEAEDLTQDAFLQLFRKIHTFRGESAFSSWLYRLTANVVLMGFRKKRPLTTSLDDFIKTDEDGPVARIEIGAPDLRLTGLCDRVNLQTAIERLPEGYRAMFLLHDVHGFEHNEIAKLLGCSTGNSKSQLHKARKRLREALTALQRNRADRGARTGTPTFAAGY
jgi:RNA polymerase sigma-70 factor, ECF subfamily